MSETTRKAVTFNSKGPMSSSGGKIGLDSETATEVNRDSKNELTRATHRHKPFGKGGIKGHPG